MERTVTQTLEALQAFIEKQQSLLVQQQDDIQRLKTLRQKARQEPNVFLDNLAQELNDPAFRLSEQGDLRCNLPDGWGWAAFQNADTGPLRSLCQEVKTKLIRSQQPSPRQTAPLSDLQRLVKEARVTIVDPILARFDAMEFPESSSESEVDPEELRREQERAKIRELKKRKIRAGGLTLPASSAWGSSAGVYILHNIEDESMDVDVALDSPAEPFLPPTPVPPKPLATVQQHRQRQPTAKKAQLNSPRTKVKIKPPRPQPLSEQTPPSDETPPKPSRTSSKPKPETYKQAWSVSEQNLLEQLLEQIPEGEKNRWQKISIAMGGRRTPRQVASRVQKYFEKLKKFGIEAS